jgi:hypothetical protein
MPVDKPGNEGFRSPSALNAAAASMLSLILSVYLAIQHWRTVNVYGVFVIFFPLGVQSSASFNERVELLMP